MTTGVGSPCESRDSPSNGSYVSASSGGHGGRAFSRRRGGRLSVRIGVRDVAIAMPSTTSVVGFLALIFRVHGADDMLVYFVGNLDL